VSLLAVAVRGRGIVDPDEPILHADDVGFLRGQGAFETVRVYAGRPFDLERHVERMVASAERLGLPAVERAELFELAAQAIDASHVADCVLRLTWSGGREGAGRATAIALASNLPTGLDALRARGQRLVSLQLGLDVHAVAGAAWLLGGVKSTSYAVNMAAQREAVRRGADDAIFVASGGIVLEGSVTNIWWREGDGLRTPSLELGILAGVTRSHVMELAAALGFSLDEGAWPVERLAGSREAFTSSSVREIMPVVELNGRPIGNGRPGDAARSLQTALRRAAEPG
jgi:4-amino-4-deoxychorismate lyase